MLETVATESCPPVALGSKRRLRVVDTDDELVGFEGYLAKLTAAISEHNSDPAAFARRETPLARMFGGMDPAEAMDASNECAHGMLPHGGWLHPACRCWDQPGVVDLTNERRRREGQKVMAARAAQPPVSAPPNVVALPVRAALPPDVA